MLLSKVCLARKLDRTPCWLSLKIRDLIAARANLREQSLEDLVLLRKVEAYDGNNT